MNARRGNTWGRHGFGAAAITGGMIGVSGVGAPARGAGSRGIGMHTDRRVAPPGGQASNPGMHPTTTSAATTAMAGVMAEATRRVPQAPPAPGGPQHVQGSGPVGAVAARYGVPEYHREAGTSEFRVNEIADQTMRNQPVGPASQFGGGERSQASVGGSGVGGSGGASVGGPGGTGGFASAQVAAQHRWGMADRSGSGPRHATPEFGSAPAESRPQPDPLNDPRPQSGAPNGASGHSNTSPSGPMDALANGPANGLSSGPMTGLPSGSANGLPSGPANGLPSGAVNGLTSGPGGGPANGPGNGLSSGPGNGVLGGPANGPAGFGGGSVSDGFLAGSVAALATGFDSYGSRDESAPSGGVPSAGGLSPGASQAGMPNSAGFGTGSMGAASGPTALGGPTTAGLSAHNGPAMGGPTAQGGPAMAGPTMAGSTIATPASGGPAGGSGPASGSGPAGGISTGSASSGSASTGSRHARPEAPELFGERSARHAAPERADIDGSALGSLDSSTLWGSLSLPSVPPR